MKFLENNGPYFRHFHCGKNCLGTFRKLLKVDFVVKLRAFTTRARYVQPSKKKKTLRTGVFQRYLYSTSFFLSRTLHLSFLLSSRGWWKKSHHPYFTRARFVQPRRTLRTRILKRYLYSISFFLSGTLHSSFLLSSEGWWTKNTHHPYITRARFVQPTRKLRTRILQRYMQSFSFFLSFFLNFTLVTCLFFFL